MYRTDDSELSGAPNEIDLDAVATFWWDMKVEGDELARRTEGRADVHWRQWRLVYERAMKGVSRSDGILDRRRGIDV